MTQQLTLACPKCGKRPELPSGKPLSDEEADWMLKLGLCLQCNPFAILGVDLTKPMRTIELPLDMVHRFPNGIRYTAESRRWTPIKLGENRK